jgi:ribosomal protein S12 methylthiotransferase accessory factor YcaO
LTTLVRYGNSTGWSAGNSEQEVISRGALEVIERDAISRFMFSVYLGHPYPCAYVELDHAPEHVRDLIAAARRWLGRAVSVLALAARDGLYVCLASAPDDDIPKRIIGKGADPDPWVACARAVGELCQIYAVHKSRWLSFDDEGHVRRFERVAPRLGRVNDLRICPGELDFVVSPTHFQNAVALDRTSWYHDLVSRLTRPLYAHVTELVAGGLYVASAYLPGAERFFLAEHGIEVVPSGDDPLAPALSLT